MARVNIWNSSGGALCKRYGFKSYDGLALIMHWLYGLIYWWMLCLWSCLVLGIEWGQVMEAACIYCTSLHTFPIGHHPSIVPLFQFFSVGCEVLQFQVFGRESSTNLPFKGFSQRYDSFLSIHDVLYVVWNKLWLSDAWILHVLENFDYV